MLWPDRTDDPEIWLPVRGREKYFEVSNHGRVRRIMTPKGERVCEIVEQYRDDSGYWKVRIGKGWRMQNQSVARLVLSAFHGEPFPGATSSHLVADKNNNRWDNLLWETMEDNFARRKLDPDTKTRHRGWKLSDDQVREIRRRYDAGECHHDLAAEFNVSSATTLVIGQRRSHRRVEESAVLTSC